MLLGPPHAIILPRLKGARVRAFRYFALAHGGCLLLDLIFVRGLFVLLVSACAAHFKPLDSNTLVAAAGGALVAAAVIFLEIRLKKVSLPRLIGAALGGAVGMLGGFLLSIVLAHVNPDNSTTLHFFQLGLVMWLGYVGLSVGAQKSDALNLGAIGFFGGDKNSTKTHKILDTSVIIDGRIADIAETGFLDGSLVIPQFVLRELQMVADSADSLKRNRGRRGLDILQRVQKIANLEVRIVEDDFPQIREVDLKLIELAKIYGCKIVTNDFNLNKVAQLRGVEVLNINELANALKPIVLPGETMRVFILKEGKEYNQGVAYLDDGTMVVVDNARRMISKTIDVSVTSVLQTTAGKMIFGKFDDRMHVSMEKPAEKSERPPRREQAVGEG